MVSLRIRKRLSNYLNHPLMFEGWLFRGFLGIVIDFGDFCFDLVFRYGEVWLTL